MWDTKEWKDCSVHQDELEGLQTDYESSGSDSPPKDMEFGIRDDFDETDPPPSFLCTDDYQSDIGKVRLSLVPRLHKLAFSQCVPLYIHRKY